MSGSHYTIRIPKRLLRIAAAGAALLLLLGWLFRAAILTAAGDFLEVRIPTGKADVIVVFAGDGGERVDRAVGLWKRGKAPLLLMSGGPLGETSWAEAMKRQAVRQGVPDSAILVQDRSTSTTEDARFSAEILKARGVRSVCLVTSSYHSRRAARAFRKALPEGAVLGVDPVVPAWWREKPWWRSDLGRLVVFNEYVKSAWSVLFGAEY